MKKYLIAVLFIFLISNSFAFAEIAMNIGMKEKVMFIASREEAIYQALEDLKKQDLEVQNVPFIPSASILSRIHPQGSLDVTYDDNLFNTDNPEKDIITTTEGGVKINMGVPELAENISRPQYKLDMDMGVGIIHYQDHPKFSRTQFDNLKPYAAINYVLGRGRHKFSFQDAFKKDMSLTSALVTGESGVIDTAYNDMLLSWESTYNRLGVEVIYKRSATYYEEDFNVRNLQGQTGSLIGFFKLFPKTQLFLEYDHGISEYPKAVSDSNDSNYDKFWIGARGNLTKKTTGNAKFGYEKRYYKDSLNNANNTTVNLDLSYQYTPKLAFMVFASQQTRDGGYLDEGVDEGYDFLLSCLYKFNRQINFNLVPMRYSRDNYKSGRVDDTWSSEAGLAYLFRRWVKMGLKISHKERNSSVPSGGYIDNVCSMIADVAF